MPSMYARLNLASAIFPFSVEAAGRTIMLPDGDENWDRYNAANTVQDKGVPQVFYMHNVMPISGGFQSIGYLPQLTSVGSVTTCDNCFPLTNSDGANYLFIPAAGQNYIYDADVGNWATFALPANSVSSDALVTTAYVQGITYIYYANYGCFYYNDTTKSFTQVTFSGLAMTNIIGICAANGYMIAWTKTAVAWSSLTDPTNFLPSIQTGSGGGQIQDAKGNINFCMSIPGGFLVYCDRNTVGASYTSNTNYPYIFSEVKGCGGVSSIDHVGYQGNLPYQVALTTAGLQQVSLDSAMATMPEVSDFLTSQLFEDFDETAQTFSYSFITSQLNVKITSVSNRFIVISYGVTAPDMTHAIVYDIELNRFGKLKLNHRGALSYIAPSLYGVVTYSELLTTPISSLGTTSYADLYTGLQIPVIPKANLAFLQNNGTIQLVDFQISEANASGVFIIGKFQFRRSTVFVHQWTEVETVLSANTFNMFLLPTFDGKDFASSQATITNNTNAMVRRYAKRFTAQNISLCFIGAFNLTSVVMNFTVGGTR